MPRFYLHVCDGTGFTEDPEGLELEDLEAARHQAVQGLRDITADDLRSGTLNMASFIEIEDENHELVATITFLEAVQVEARHAKRPGR